MNKVRFLGAAGTVTGSGYFLYDDQTGRGIVIDLGMFQGLPEIANMNYNELQLDVSKIDGVLLTHAHLDHCGRIPLLAKLGYKGKVYMTEPTAMLAELTLFDTAKIAKEGKDGPPIYTDIEVDAILRQTQVIYYHQEFKVGKFTIRYIDAGHILGSASILITDPTVPEGQKNYVFSGDIGNYPEDIVRPTEFPEQADFVVMESTYGDRPHVEGDPYKELQEEINAIEQTNGVLLVPAFALEKTQELIHAIGHLKKDKKVRYETPVFVDSPMAIKATQIYKQFEELFNTEMAAHMKASDPFYFAGLQMILKSQRSKKIKEIEGPKVIIAGGGMMTGGRILQHLTHYVHLRNSRLLITGYQGEDTLGREIEEGTNPVMINEREVSVRANIRKLNGMSSHADQGKLLEWIGKIKGVKRICLAHGEDGPRTVLKDKIQNELDIYDIHLPKLNQEITIA